MSEKQGSLWQRLVQQWRKRVGNNVTVQHDTNEYSDSRYVVTTDNDGRMEVVCTEVRYAKVDERTQRVVSETSQYMIRCECSEELHEELRMVLEKDRVVPCLSGRSVGAEARRREAVQAYFDLVRTELKARRAA